MRIRDNIYAYRHNDLPFLFVCDTPKICRSFRNHLSEMMECDNVLLLISSSNEMSRESGKKKDAKEYARNNVSIYHQQIETRADQWGERHGCRREHLLWYLRITIEVGSGHHGCRTLK